ncbi:MAG TPA: hypothetical protein DGR79_07650 [Clostridiales bacterium]|nr:hypothetical protein [Clostridiales bacterium]
MKKLLISTLVAVMVLTCASVSVAAADIEGAAFSDIAGHEAEAELTLLGAMGVYSGEYGLGGPVNPDSPITRAQFCKVVVEAIGRGSLAESLATVKPAFADEIPGWAWGYVNVAVFAGIISGYPDGTFKPDNPVTYAEAVTMLVRAVSGHLDQVGDQPWPYNFIFYGVDEGFTGDVDVGFVNLPATRGDIAKMLFATMQVPKLDKDRVEKPDSAVLFDRVDENGVHYGLMYEGLFADYTVGDETTTIHIEEAGWSYDLTLADTVYIVGADSLDDLRWFPVRLIVNDDGEVIFIQVLETARVVSGIVDAVVDSEDDEDDLLDTIVLADGTEIPFDPEVGVNVTLNQFENLDAEYLLAGDEVAINLNSDGMAVNCIAHRFRDVDFIVSVTEAEYDEEGNETSPTQIELYGAATTYPVQADCQVTGDVTKRGKLAEWDVAEVALTLTDATDPSTLTFGDPYLIRVERETVAGTVTKVTTTYPGPVTKVTIEKADGTTATYEYVVLNESEMPEKDDVVNYGLDFNGDLFVEIGFEGATPFVLLLSYRTEADDAYLTVDLKGTETTYPLASDYSGPALDDNDLYNGVTFAELTTGGANSPVSRLELYTLEGATWYDVLAVDASGKGMTVQNLGNGNIEYITDALVYSYDADSGRCEYVPLADVSADWDLRRLGSTPLFVHLDVEAGFTFHIQTGTDLYHDVDDFAGTYAVITVRFTNPDSIHDNTLVRYKAVLTSQGEPVANESIQYWDDGAWAWLSMSTDSDGVAWFGPSGGFTVGSVPELKTTGRSSYFRASLADDEYELDLYVVDVTNAQQYLLVGDSVTFTVPSP